MIIEDKMKEGLEELKGDYGIVEELKEMKESVIEQFGSVENLIDTYEETQKQYVAYLRGGTNE